MSLFIMRKTNKLVLVDGSSYLYRAFHALPPLTAPDGFPTAVIHGVLKMLKSLISEEKPDLFAAVFDAKGKTFRHRIYPEYKAQRPPMPEELAMQIGPLFELIRYSGYPLLQVEGVEADDVIGTLAYKAVQAGCEVVVSTGDKDLTQLVNDKITLVDTMKKEKLDRAGVEKKMHVKPEVVVDYLTLIGDKSDNVPGVHGVGPKTAEKWLEKYKNLDGVLRHSGQMTGKAADNLRADKEKLPLYRELVTIKCDLDIDVEIGDLCIQNEDLSAAAEICRSLGLKQQLDEIESQQSDKPEYQLILDEKSFNQWLELLKSAGEFAVDTETTSLNYMKAEIVGISFAVVPKQAAYVPFGHNYAGVPAQLSRADVLAALKPLLEDERIRKIGHHLKYDRNVLANYGICLQGIYHDTMMESYVYNSVAGRHDLVSLAERCLLLSKTGYEDVAGKGVKAKPFNSVELQAACDYAAEDADVCLRLHHFLWPKLKATDAGRKIYREIELPLIEVLSDIERKGVCIDADALSNYSRELGQRIEEIKAMIYQAAGHAFNIDSPKQIRNVLFEEKGLPVRNKTPGGEASTAEQALRDLAYGHTLPRLILDYRTLKKLQSTYTDKLCSMTDAVTGRVHTSYHQAVTATGRLSSSDPNLQNIPVRSAEGRRIREAFVAPEGCRLIAADYSQIELRIMAHLCGDEKLCEAFDRGEDIHTLTAAEIFGAATAEVTSDQRRSAKAINFGLIYGMSAFGLARQLDIDNDKAAQYLDTYFKRYPGIKSYMDKVRVSARTRGYVETIFGRRLYVPDIKSANVHRRKAAERTAINAPMQGSAADIIKRAMIKLHRYFQETRVRAAIVMQVHDELVLEVAVEDVDRMVEICQRLMTSNSSLKTPLSVDIGIGGNWEEAH